MTNIPPATATELPSPGTNAETCVHYGIDLTGSTPEEKQAQYDANWRHAEAAVHAGKAICLSDLMAQACQVPARRKPTKPRGRLAHFLAMHHS